MVMCVTNPETRHRRGSPGFRRITIALFCAGLSTFDTHYAVQALLRAIHFLCERNAHVDQ
jgi:MFS transporter, YNFM family, putative membrane transport protein